VKNKSRSVSKLLSVLALAGGLSVSVLSWSEEYVIKTNLKKIYLYDAEYNEVDSLSARKFKALMTEHTTVKGTVKGIEIVKRDADEAMIGVKLPGYAEPVWLEMMGLELSNKKKIPCPKGRQGLEKSNPGVTIGFGDSCEPVK
jgi:hypothetical protein